MPINDEMPLYVISVAAELSGLHPQTLRTYDRMGLVSPRRMANRDRCYSRRDVRTLCEIRWLSRDVGVNLADIKRILDARRERGSTGEGGIAPHQILAERV
ncbi:MerR family transcriptional regulator [Streptomyces sp. PRh5]|uniref:heat shock protein transcriptional repressor HspR n=1 Tax=Streptomyces hygroscopicus TaxID=1912 RepID=UPI000451FC46|nr:MerR family transcriptional regulator [Streptomyces sp. PRh5]